MHSLRSDSSTHLHNNMNMVFFWVFNFLGLVRVGDNAAVWALRILDFATHALLGVADENWAAMHGMHVKSLGTFTL